MNGVVMPATGARLVPPRQRLTICVVNNMAPAARQATVRQFKSLLGAAAFEHEVELTFCRAGPEIAADEVEMEAVLHAEPDGLIVTGAEPRSARLSDDPIWPRITRLADWAEEAGKPVIWSCLAAHAAVLYLDEIERVTLAHKVSGVFSGEVAALDHPLMADVAEGWHMPHSRCNTLPEEALTRRGYTILARAPEVGVDLFEKRERAPFLFVQSHPEYDADTLLREFQRDLRRYQSGERATPPSLPSHDTGRASWRSLAVRLYRNWLREVVAVKTLDDGPDLTVAHLTPSHAQHQSDLLPC